METAVELLASIRDNHLLPHEHWEKVNDFLNSTETNRLVEAEATIKEVDAHFRQGGPLKLALRSKVNRFLRETRSDQGHS